MEEVDVVVEGGVALELRGVAGGLAGLVGDLPVDAAFFLGDAADLAVADGLFPALLLGVAALGGGEEVAVEGAEFLDVLPVDGIGGGHAGHLALQLGLAGVDLCDEAGGGGVSIEVATAAACAGAGLDDAGGGVGAGATKIGELLAEVVV